jgi:hypothetical protein
LAEGVGDQHREARNWRARRNSVFSVVCLKAARFPVGEGAVLVPDEGQGGAARRGAVEIEVIHAVAAEQAVPVGEDGLGGSVGEEDGKVDHLAWPRRGTGHRALR